MILLKTVSLLIYKLFYADCWFKTNKLKVSRKLLNDQLDSTKYTKLFLVEIQEILIWTTNYIYQAKQKPTANRNFFSKVGTNQTDNTGPENINFFVTRQFIIHFVRSITRRKNILQKNRRDSSIFVCLEGDDKKICYTSTHYSPQQPPL